MAKSTSSKDPVAAAAVAPRKGRGWRRIRRIGIVLLALAVTGIVIITQTGVVGSLALKRLESTLGCIASASSTRVTLDGRVIMRDLELRAPGIDGPAAMFFQAPEVIVEPVWLSLLTSSPRIDRMVVRQPVVRICQDDALRLNVGALATGGSSTSTLIPTVDVENGVIEFGEFGPGWYTPLTSLRVQGKLARIAPKSSRYMIQLVETQRQGPGGDAEGLHLDGEFDLADLSGSLRLGNIDFGRFRDTPAPSRIEPLWRQLALAGSLRDTEFSYSPQTGVVAVFRLERVDLNIPLPAERTEEGATEPARSSEELLRMRSVSGTIRMDRVGLHADLAGTIEDLGCRVTLETKGYSLDAALECHIRADEFRLSERPLLLPFAPFIVKRNFERFSGPTALVTGEVEIRRGAPVDGQVGAMVVNGLISFSEGSARFEKFPYPFSNMAGTIRFDETKVTIEKITGVGPTGARLEATGLVAPPVVTAGVRVDIVVTDAPADDVLYEAIPAHRRSMYDSLFSREEYVTLQAAGIVQSAESQRIAVARRAELERQIEALRFESDSEAAIENARTEIAALDARLAAPVFELAGICEIRVTVERKEGENHEYETSILVSLPKAGLLPEAFPYPVIAQDFTLSINDTRAVAEAPMLKGLSGASGSMKALIEFQHEGPDDFDIRVGAFGIQVDNALLAALDRRDRARPGRAANQSHSKLGNFSPAHLVRALGVSGRGSCDAHVVSRDQGTITYSIGVEFSDARAQPGGADLELTGIDGSLAISEDKVRIRDLRGRIGAGLFTADFGVSGLADSQATPPVIAGAMEVTDLDLKQPFERVIEAFSPEHAEALRALREKHDPSGRVDASVTLGSTSDELEYQVDLSRPHAVSFTALGGRLAINDSSGLFSITDDSLRCNRFTATVVYENEPAGDLALDGVWPLGSGEGATGVLSIQLRGGQFASPIVRAFAKGLDKSAAEWLEAVQLQGVFDVVGSAHALGAGRSYFEGSLSPRTISVTRRGVRTDFDPVEGSITFGPDGGRIDSLVGRCAEWSFTADGSWKRSPAPAMDLSLTIDSVGLSESLVALLPTMVGDTRTSIGLRVDGPLTIRDARLLLDAAPEDGAPTLDVSLSAIFQQAEIDPGFALSTQDGLVTARLQSFDLEASPLLDLTLTAPACNAGGVQLSDASIRLRSGEAPGVYVLEGGRASAHGGELAVEGSIRVSAEGGGRAYEVQLGAAGMDFASLLAELSKPGSEAQPEDPQSADSQPQTPLVGGERGTLDAYIGLAGPLGDIASRRGAGIIRVQGGEVIALPGLTGLLRLSNLQAPIGEVLDHASALFHIQGQEVNFEKIEAASDSFAIVGSGTMQWPSTDLNLTFNTRGSEGVPILSDLFRGLRDEIVTTEMTGTLRDPQSRMVQLPATRRMLGTIFRGEPREKPPEATKTASPGSAGAQESSHE